MHTSMSNIVAPSNEHLSRGVSWETIRRFGFAPTACALIGIGLSAMSSGCATTNEPMPIQTAQPAPAPPEPEGYETPPVLQASAVVYPEFLKGPHHVVSDRVVNDGYTNHYVIQSEFGEFHAAGMDMLELRVTELQAIAAMREMNRPEAFGKGMATGAKRTVTAPVRQVKKHIHKPLNFILVVPGDVMRAVGIINDVRTIARLGLTEAYVKELIGYEDARKDLADKFAVDADSPNPVLQAELDRTTWSFYGGSVPMYLLDEYVPEVPIPHITLVEDGESAQDALDIYRNELGDKSVRTQLRRMDVPRADRKALKDHPHYSSRDRKNLARALYSVKDATGRDTYIRLALTANSAQEAELMVHHAQMISTYHAHFEPVVEIGTADSLGLCYTENGVVMLPLYGDHVAWTSDFAEKVQAVSDWSPTVGEVKQREIWVLGNVTPRASQALQASAFRVHEDAYDILADASKDQQNGQRGFLARLWNQRIRGTTVEVVDSIIP